MSLKGKTLFITGASRGIGSRSRCAPLATAPISRSRPRQRPRMRASVVASSKGRQEQAGGQAAATVAARAAILPALCSVDYRHQHIDMVIGAPWRKQLALWRSY